MQRRIALLLLALATTVVAYPEGAPQDACDNMEPNHEERVRQKGLAPFTVAADKTRYTNGDPIVVTIQSKSAEKSFRGFLMVARKIGSQKNEGAFFPLDTNSQALECGAPEDAITHTNYKDKTNTSVQWVPSETFKGSIVFTATIVNDYETFWTNVKSRPVSIQ